MLVERDLNVMNFDTVGEAYAIAANYLRRTGAVSEGIGTNDKLLEIIVGLFHRGERTPHQAPQQGYRAVRGRCLTAT